VKVPFTWKVTGWFMVGWSPEFPIGEESYEVPA
jgi:3-ketosteroid 9alpha-monooxygenase subunit A